MKTKETENTEQTEKKYKCFASKIQPWWSINSIDKPDWRYFRKTYGDTFTEIDITPNWVDTFTIDIVVDSYKIRMIKIENIEGFPYYFLSSKILKKLTKGYVIRYDLDIWLTFGEHFFNSLASITDYTHRIKVNRIKHLTLTKNTSSLFWKIAPAIIFKKDPVINFDGFNKIEYQEDIIINMNNLLISNGIRGTDFGFYKLYKKTFNNKPLKLYQDTRGSNNMGGKPFVSVYQKPNGNFICFLNVVGKIYLENLFTDNEYYQMGQFGMSVDLGGGSEYKRKPLWLLGGEYDIDPYNNPLSVVLTAPQMVNKFVGVFECPFINSINDWVIVGDMINPRDGTPEISLGLDGSCLCFELSNTGALKLGRKIKPLEVWGGQNGWTSQYNTKLNNDLIVTNIYPGTGIDSSVSSWSWNDTKSKIRFLSTFISMYDWNFKTGLMDQLFAYKLVTFDGSKFNINIDPEYPTSYYSPNGLNMLGIIGTNYNSCMGTLNVSTDSYLDYVNQTKVMQNAQLEIAKQERDFSVKKSITSGVLGSIGGVAQSIVGGVMGNPFAVSQGITNSINSISNSVFNVERAEMKYNNTKKTIDAQNLTARNTSVAQNYRSSVTTDDINNKIGIRRTPGISYNKFGVSFPTRENDLDNFLSYWLQYGYFVDETFRSDELFASLFDNVRIFDYETNFTAYGEDDYVYFDIEMDEWFINFNFQQQPEEIRNALMIMCNNSFRIWIKRPQYQKLNYKY